MLSSKNVLKHLQKFSIDVFKNKRTEHYPIHDTRRTNVLTISADESNDVKCSHTYIKRAIHQCKGVCKSVDMKLHHFEEIDKISRLKEKYDHDRSFMAEVNKRNIFLFNRFV